MDHISYMALKLDIRDLVLLLIINQSIIDNRQRVDQLHMNES